MSRAIPPQMSFRTPASTMILMLALAVPAFAALDASQVLILVNRDVSVSGRVAQMYQKERGIPDTNILRLSMGADRQITPQQYWSKAGEPIRKYLEEHTDIRCILTTSGVPYTVAATDGADEGAAFDSELAIVMREEPGGKTRRQANPLYLDGLNPYGITEPRALKMVYVVRLGFPAEVEADLVGRQSLDRVVERIDTKLGVAPVALDARLLLSADPSSRRSPDRQAGRSVQRR